MRKRTVFLMVLVCLFSVGVAAQARKYGSKSAHPAKGQTLPIRRVILYSNGVAYIERRGIVSGNAEIDLAFKQSQVDDILKSMIVLDLGKGKIGAVSYPSSAPPSARMKEIPFSVSAVTSGSTQAGGIAGVLSQLQGAKVVVTTASGAATGAVLTVEKRSIKTEKSSVSQHFLVIASEAGEISSFNLSKVKSVKLLDKETKRDVKEFARASASTRRRDAKTITVSSVGTGQRELVVSYTIAAPIWKTTYRVVLDEEGKPFFQGWAIIDNVSKEDWKNVKLSLVSGSPISFIQKLQRPYYRYRPVVPLPGGVQISPQTHETGVRTQTMSTSISGVVVDQTEAVIPGANVVITNNSNGKRYNVTTGSNGFFTVANLPRGNYSVRINASGFNVTNVSNVKPGTNLSYPLHVGGVTATVNVEAASLGNNFMASQIIELPKNKRKMSSVLAMRGGSTNFTPDGIKVSDAIVGTESGIETAATGDEIGDLFEYKITQPVTVNRNRSALIPIVQTRMEGERVSIYNEAVRKSRPLGGMLLVNSTPLTFESGSLTVIDRDAYAGEALMKRLKPKEQRLISFALDLGTNVRVRTKQDRDPAKLIKVVRGVFQVHFFRSNRKSYSITNQTDRKKVVYIEYPIKNGWKLSAETPKPDYSTQSYHRFRVELDAFETKDLEVAENQPLMETYHLSSLSRTTLALFVRRRYIDEETRKRLEKLIDLRSEIGKIDSQLQTFTSEENAISRDQKRLRQNIEALSKTAEAKQLIARYVSKADKQETRIEQITLQRQKLAEQKQRLVESLAAAIRDFRYESRSTD